MLSSTVLFEAISLNPISSFASHRLLKQNFGKQRQVCPLSGFVVFIILFFVQVAIYLFFKVHESSR